MARRISQPGFPRQKEVRIRVIPRIRSLPFLGLLLLGLTASGFTAVLPPVVRFLVVTSIFTWIPGGVLLTRFLGIRARGLALEISLYFLAGLSLVSILSWLAAWAGISFDAYVAALQWIAALFFAAGMAADVMKRAAPERVRETLALPVSTARIYVAVAAALAVATAMRQPVPDYQQDAFDHIGYVRHVELENSLTPEGVLAPPAAGDAAPPKADPRKGTFHSFAAAASRLAEVEPTVTLGFLAVILFPLAFLNFLLFCSVFVPKRGLLAGCAGLFLLFQGGIGFEYPNTAAYGLNLSLLFYWLLVPLSFMYFVSARRKTLLVTMLLFAGGAFIHAGVLLHFLILAATVFVFRRPLRLPRRPVILFCVWGGVTAAVAAAWRMMTSIGVGNVIHLHPQGLLYLSERQFVLSPVLVVEKNGLVFLGGLLAVPLFAFACRRSAAAARLLIFAVIPLALCFTPYLTPLLFKSATYMLFRSLVNVPVYPLVVVGFWGLAVWARRGGLARKILGAAVLLVWSWTFLSPSLGAVKHAAAGALSGKRPPDFSRNYEDLETFLDKLPAGSVVLSDPVTSYWISAYTDLRVVTVLGQHGNPNDLTAMNRLKSVRDVLSPFTVRSEAVAALDRYGVEYVVVNGRLGRGRPEYLVDWSSDYFEDTREKLEPMTTLLRKVFEAGGVVVYKYYPGPVADRAWGPEVPIELTGPENPSRCRVRGPGRQFEIKTAGISPTRALPGETVYVTLGYDKQDVTDYTLPTVVYLRFDHESITLDSPGIPGEKYLRRFRDRRRGDTARFRYDHRPFGGYYATDIWPIGRPFFEVVAVKLPATLRKGKYTVQVKAVTQPLVPNFWLRDFLFNRDQYSGVPCLELEVADYAVRTGND